MVRATQPGAAALRLQPAALPPPALACDGPRPMGQVILTVNFCRSSLCLAALFPALLIMLFDQLKVAKVGSHAPAGLRDCLLVEKRRGLCCQHGCVIGCDDKASRNVSCTPRGPCDRPHAPCRGANQPSQRDPSVKGAAPSERLTESACVLRRAGRRRPRRDAVGVQAFPAGAEGDALGAMVAQDAVQGHGK